MRRLLRRVLCVFGWHRDGLIERPFLWYSQHVGYDEVEFETRYAIYWRCADCRRLVWLGHDRPRSESKS